jgi:hypothetical protein
MTRPELIAALQSAAEGSDEFDGEIHFAVMQPGWDRDPPAKGAVEQFKRSCPYPYTRSVDAALSLLPGASSAVSTPPSDPAPVLSRKPRRPWKSPTTGTALSPRRRRWPSTSPTASKSAWRPYSTELGSSGIRARVTTWPWCALSAVSLDAMRHTLPSPKGLLKSDRAG